MSSTAQNVIGFLWAGVKRGKRRRRRRGERRVVGVQMVVVNETTYILIF